MESVRPLRVPPSDPSDAAFVYEPCDDVDVLHVFGELSYGNEAEFESALVSAVRLSRTTVLDLLGCDFIDARSLSVIVRARRALGEKLRIAAPESGIVRTVLTFGGFAFA
jgi:anti-anti-sigma factor